MSKVSICEAPPFIHRRMQRLLLFFTSAAAERDWASPPQLGSTSPDPVTRAPLRNARRLRCSRAEQNGVMSTSPLDAETRSRKRRD